MLRYPYEYFSQFFTHQTHTTSMKIGAGRQRFVYVRRGSDMYVHLFFLPRFAAIYTLMCVRTSSATITTIQIKKTFLLFILFLSKKVYMSSVTCIQTRTHTQRILKCRNTQHTDYFYMKNGDSLEHTTHTHIWVRFDIYIDSPPTSCLRMRATQCMSRAVKVRLQRPLRVGVLHLQRS